MKDRKQRDVKLFERSISEPKKYIYIYTFTLIPKSNFMAQVLLCMSLSFIRHLRGTPSHQSQHYLNNTKNNFDFLFFV